MSWDALGAALAVRGLNWWPTAHHVIVRDIAFAVAPGETIAIVEPNEAGKSSLLYCLFRAHRPLSGSVRLDGEDIWLFNPRAVARSISAVLQEMPADFPFSVADMVQMCRIPNSGRVCQISGNWPSCLKLHEISTGLDPVLLLRDIRAAQQRLTRLAVITHPYFRSARPPLAPACQGLCQRFRHREVLQWRWWCGRWLRLLRPTWRGSRW